MTRGFSNKEVLACLAAILIAAAILFWVGTSMKRKDAGQASAERMRRVYIALSLYEGSNNAQPAPDLTFVNLYLPEPKDYQSAGDPYLTAAGPFPADGSLPTSPRHSPYRISLGYLWAHRPTGKSKPWDWSRISTQSNLGFLADEWGGNVTPLGDFKANVSGPVMRVNRDGSLQHTPDRGGPKPLGDIEDLFGFVP